MSRFMFDTPFDDASAKTLAKKKAAAEPPPPPEPKYGQADIDAVRAMAFQEGVEQGRNEALGEIEARIADLLDRLTGDIDQLFESERRTAEQARRDAIDVALTVARKLASALADKNAATEIETLVAGALADLHGEPRVTIKVAESVADALRARLDDLVAREGFGGRVQIAVDPSMLPGDCRIEWGDGGIVRSIADIESKIDDAVSAFTGAGGPEGN